MKALRYITLILILLSLAFCRQEDSQSEKPDPFDSASRAMQRRAADSMKKRNPLLIIPPDSVYTGDYVDKYPSGVTKFRGQFRFGQRHGHWMSFYPNGNAWSEMHYDKGLRHGPNITYFENGQIFYQGLYINDKQDSVWNYFDSTGRMVKKVLYKADRIVKELPLK